MQFGSVRRELRWTKNDRFCLRGIGKIARAYGQVKVAKYMPAFVPSSPDPKMHRHTPLLAMFTFTDNEVKIRLRNLDADRC